MDRIHTTYQFGELDRQDLSNHELGGFSLSVGLFLKGYL